MTEVTRFQLGFQTPEADLEPGDLFRRLDGTVWKVNPNGSFTQLGGGGGAQNLGEVLTVGNDGGGLQAKNLAAGTDPGDAATVSQLSATPGARRTLGPFPIAFNSPNIRTGHAIGYTPNVGDIIWNAFFDVTEAWDGTNPKGDISLSPPSGTGGWFQYAYADWVDMTLVSGPGGSGDSGISRLGTEPLHDWDAAGTVVDLLQVPAIGAGGHAQQPLASLAMGDFAGSGNAFPATPMRVTDAFPVIVWVTQNGAAGGTSPGSTQGAADIYLEVASPSMT